MRKVLLFYTSIFYGFFLLANKVFNSGSDLGVKTVRLFSSPKKSKEVKKHITNSFSKNDVNIIMPFVWTGMTSLIFILGLIGAVELITKQTLPPFIYLLIFVIVIFMNWFFLLKGDRYKNDFNLFEEKDKIKPIVSALIFFLTSFSLMATIVVIR